MQKFKLNILDKRTTRNTMTKTIIKNIIKNILFIFGMFLSSIFLGVLFLELITRM